RPRIHAQDPLDAESLLRETWQLHLLNSQVTESQRDANVGPQTLDCADGPFGGRLLIKPRHILAEEASDGGKLLAACRQIEAHDKGQQEPVAGTVRTMGS